MLRRTASFLSSVQLAAKENARVVLLNREKALNSLDMDMLHILFPMYQQLTVESATDKKMFVVMQGAGQKAFCAGGDVVALVKDTTGETRKRFFYDEYQINHAIATLPTKHVAIWDGVVMGGGFGVSAHGSHRLCTEATTFAMPETGIGLFPDVGGSWVLPRLPKEGLGMYLALTGQRLKGYDTVHAGLGTHFVERSNVPTVVEQLTSKEAEAATVDKILQRNAPSTEPPTFSLAPHIDDIAKHFGHQATSVEGIVSSLKEANTEWSNKQVSILSKMSPSSLKISFELQRRGAKATTMQEVLEMEYNVAQRCMQTNDFNSGVSALLIEKTGKPVWQPSSLGDVTDEIVASHFVQCPGSPVWHPTLPFGEASKL